AEFLPLLVDAVKIGFVDQVGDGLVGQESAGGQRGDGGEIELAGVAAAADQEPSLIDDQGSGGITLIQQLFQNVVELLDVFLDKLGKRGHVMRTAEFPG